MVTKWQTSLPGHDPLHQTLMLVHLILRVQFWMRRYFPLLRVLRLMIHHKWHKNVMFKKSKWVICYKVYCNSSWKQPLNTPAGEMILMMNFTAVFSSNMRQMFKLGLEGKSSTFVLSINIFLMTILFHFLFQNAYHNVTAEQLFLKRIIEKNMVINLTQDWPDSNDDAK